MSVNGCALDLFTGTSTVAQEFKRLGFITHANDWQYYSYVTAKASVELNQIPHFEMLRSQLNIDVSFDSACPNGMSVPIHSAHIRKRMLSNHPAVKVLWFLSRLEGITGIFFHTYCEGGESGRQYFSKNNGQKIQVIGDTIQIWKESRWIDDLEEYWLKSVLIESADRIANTASVYGAYLKHIKKSALKPIELVCIQPGSDTASHKAFRLDARTYFQYTDSEYTLLYLDPPYNQRQYNGNYHILETIARWDLDTFEPRGKTGLRPAGGTKSPFCSTKNAFQALKDIFLTARTKHILFSYSDEGLLTRPEIEELFRLRCDIIEFVVIKYDRFKADIDSVNRKYSGKKVQEYLVFGTVRNATNG